MHQPNRASGTMPLNITISSTSVGASSTGKVFFVEIVAVLGVELDIRIELGVNIQHGISFSSWGPVGRYAPVRGVLRAAAAEESRRLKLSMS
jgi:hypothetical protein